MYSKYIERADAFFDALLPLVTGLQFTVNGPIIAVQVENEYGNFGYGDHPRDTAYLQHLMDKMKEMGIKEMFFTSDSPTKGYDWGSVPGGKLSLVAPKLYRGCIDVLLLAIIAERPSFSVKPREFGWSWFI